MGAYVLRRLLLLPVTAAAQRTPSTQPLTAAERATLVPGRAILERGWGGRYGVGKPVELNQITVVQVGPDEFIGKYKFIRVVACQCWVGKRMFLSIKRSHQQTLH